jgi:hypothetical protein
MKKGIGAVVGISYLCDLVKYSLTELEACPNEMRPEPGPSRPSRGSKKARGGTTKGRGGRGNKKGKKSTFGAPDE